MGGVLIALLAAGLYLAWKKGLLDQPLRDLATMAQQVGFSLPGVAPPVDGAALQQQWAEHGRLFQHGSKAQRRRAREALVEVVDQVIARVGDLSNVAIAGRRALATELKASAVQRRDFDLGGASAHIAVALWLEATTLPTDPAAAEVAAACWQEIDAALARTDRADELRAALDLPDPATDLATDPTTGAAPALLPAPAPDALPGLAEETAAVLAVVEAEVAALPEPLVLDQVPVLAGYVIALARLIAETTERPALTEPVARATMAALAPSLINPLLRAARFTPAPEHLEHALALGDQVLTGAAAEALAAQRATLLTALSTAEPACPGLLPHLLALVPPPAAAAE
ncbi:MAG: hypothetical protein SF002_15655 [Alphaproteobacteria bacterium]|nr:hypothetical protein [Alphaproteobacteria bacterium]